MRHGSALGRDLRSPGHAQDLGACGLPALDRLTAGPQLGAVVGIDPGIAPADRVSPTRRMS